MLSIIKKFFTSNQLRKAPFEVPRVSEPKLPATSGEPGMRIDVEMFDIQLEMSVSLDCLWPFRSYNVEVRVYRDSFAQLFQLCSRDYLVPTSDVVTLKPGQWTTMSKEGRPLVLETYSLLDPLVCTGPAYLLVSTSAEKFEAVRRGLRSGRDWASTLEQALIINLEQ